MTATPHADVIRLHVTRRPSIDTEGPYIDDDPWLRPTIDGSLALALPASYAPPLHLVPVIATPSPAQARLWEDADDPVTETPAAEPSPDDSVTFDPVRTPRPSLPPPMPHAATMVRAILEVLAGDRSIRQLARCSTPEVYDELEVLVSPRTARPWAGSLRRLLLCEPVPGVAEVTAIVAQGARTVAMALRLEGMDGRWQLTALQLG